MLWILLWIAITLSVFGAWFWSAGIDLRQAKAWRAFAKKNKMQFVQKGFLQPPAVIGTLGGYTARLYTLIENNAVMRRKSIWTFAEVDLHTTTDNPFVIALKNYEGLFEAGEGTRASLAGIQAEVNKCSDVAEVERFFTADRLDALKEFWTHEEGCEPVIMSNASAMTLVVKTGDALAHPRDIHAVFKYMIDAANKIDKA